MVSEALLTVPAICRAPKAMGPEVETLTPIVLRLIDAGAIPVGKNKLQGVGLGAGNVGHRKRNEPLSDLCSNVHIVCCNYIG